MARNPVQFQKGMSLAAFQAEYGGKESCEAALRAQRWPRGFVCPKCKGRKHSYCVRRRLYQCSARRTQNLAQSRHDLSQVQGSADDMVPRHLSSDAKQKR